MTPCKGMTPAVTAAAIAPMIIVSIFFSPSFNDIIYHDILSRSLLIYLLWQNRKMKTSILQGSSPNQPISVTMLFLINRLESGKPFTKTSQYSDLLLSRTVSLRVLVR